MKENNVNKEGLIEYAMDLKFKFEIDLLPIKISFGKIPNTYWIEPVFKTKRGVDWFYDEFVPEIRRMIDETGVYLYRNQRNPSYSSVGWYLPLPAVIYIVESYTTLNVGYAWDVVRPLSTYDYKFKDEEK